MSTLKLTELEKKVIEGINNSDFGENLGDPVWAGTERCTGVGVKQVKGVLSSLVKKEVVFISHAGTDDATYHLTALGVQICKENPELLGKFKDDLSMTANFVVVRNMPERRYLTAKGSWTLNFTEAQLFSKEAADLTANNLFDAFVLPEKEA